MVDDHMQNNYNFFSRKAVILITVYAWPVAIYKAASHRCIYTYIYMVTYRHIHGYLQTYTWLYLRNIIKGTFIS